MAEPLKFDKLSTSYVNLAAFIRYLRENEFQGRLHVELDQYEGDIFFYGGDTPSAWEIDRTTNREEQGDAAMQRLLVRSREPGGVITVFENAETKVVAEPAVDEPAVFTDNSELATATSEVIAAVERAATIVGADFNAAFHSARVELGDDYPFIDPTSGTFEYEAGVAKLDATTPETTVVKGVSGVLKKVVETIAASTDGVRFRELVATELGAANSGAFASQLDRISGK